MALPGSKRHRSKADKDKATQESTAPTGQAAPREQQRPQAEAADRRGEEGRPDGSAKAVRGDEAVGRAIGKAGRQVSGAAKGAGHSIVSGYGALRDVRAASKKLSSAQADLKKIRQGLDEDRSVLAHREDIERRYPQIVSEQDSQIAEAKEQLGECQRKTAALQRSKDKVSKNLAAMRADHEARIKPYRNLMDSSRGRSDDAAKSLANVRRALKDAEAQVSSATKRRDQRVSAANQAVDSAKERLNRVQMELDGLMADEGSSVGAIKKMQAEVAAEREHIESAQQEVASITADAQSTVDTAQKALFAQQKLLKEAEQTAETAKAEAQGHKTEHDSLYREMQAQEKGLEDKIKLYDTQMADLAKQREASERRVKDAQRVLGEANDIHNNPATTAGLRERIANEEGDAKEQEAEVARLSKRAKSLKRETRGSRFAAVALLVIVVIVLIVLLYFFVANPGAGDSLTGAATNGTSGVINGGVSNAANGVAGKLGTTAANVSAGA